MNQYLLEVELQDLMSAEFMALIPEQREQINTLIADGIISFFCFSLEESKAWTAVNADTEQEALHILESMPMGDFMDAKIFALAYFNMANLGLPAISLN